ncbi:MAG TPA: hypothetical protein VF171_05250 [Trueperaceae bacterium]
MKHPVVEITPAGVFTPGTLEAPAGTTVVWHNASTEPQTVLYDPSLVERRSSLKTPAGATPWTSGLLFPGETFAHTFDQAGSYLVFLRTPAANNAAGLIRVRDAGAGQTPARRTPAGSAGADGAQGSTSPKKAGTGGTTSR